MAYYVSYDIQGVSSPVKDYAYALSQNPFLFIPVCDFLLILTTKADINYYQIITSKMAYA